MTDKRRWMCGIAALLHRINTVLVFKAIYVGEMGMAGGTKV